MASRAGLPREPTCGGAPNKDSYRRSSFMTVGMKQRAAVLISGRGSNMAALAAAARDPAYPVELVLVLSNRAQAPGLGLAAALGVPTAVVEHRPFKGDRAAHEA